MATHSSTLAWKIPWVEEPGRLQSMGSLRAPASTSKCTVTTALSSNTIAKGGTITATVTVVLNENVSVAVDPINWTIEYTATSIEP